MGPWPAVARKRLNIIITIVHRCFACCLLNSFSTLPRNYTSHKPKPKTQKTKASKQKPIHLKNKNKNPEKNATKAKKPDREAKAHKHKRANLNPKNNALTQNI
jgi:hypothetical protein